MSDKNFNFIAGIFLIILAAYGGGVIGYHDGERKGHAEMKRWQDEWYAAHPVTVAPNPNVTYGGSMLFYPSNIKGGLCSIDGKSWFPARDDGTCYASDAPLKPLMAVASSNHEQESVCAKSQKSKLSTRRFIF